MFQWISPVLTSVVFSFLMISCSSQNSQPAASSAQKADSSVNRKVAQTSYTYICGLYRRWFNAAERKAGTYEAFGSEESMEVTQGDQEYSAVTFETSRESVQAFLTREGIFKVYGRSKPEQEMQLIGQYRGPVQVNGYYQAIQMPFEIPGIQSDTYQIQCQ